MPFSFYYGVYYNIAQIALSRHIRREGEGQRERVRGRGKETEEESTEEERQRRKERKRDTCRETLKKKIKKTKQGMQSDYDGKLLSVLNEKNYFDWRQ